MLEDRRADVLRALVEEHIRTGEPVSSRAILELTGLEVSSATIRNDLAALEKEGYVVQPHTSAGRVPTARAYRYYVDHLTPTRLRTPAQTRVARFFSTVHLELSKLLKSTTELLSEITHYPAVVVGPGPRGEVIRAVDLVQLGARTVLLVVVTESGRVSQEVCRLPEPLTPGEVEEVERLLAASLCGRELGDELSVGESEAQLSPPAQAAVEAACQALTRAATASADIYVGGTRQMATVWEDLATVHRVLEVLEREAMILNILARAPGTFVQIGEELPVSDQVDMAVVSTSFEAGSHTAGRVGVIGPMRMDYATAISAVETVGRELGGRISAEETS
jgi:heat-inducible transcriptional repressor